MSEDTIMKKYVIENIDRAVARGLIKVYYQPVVRTLTDKVCGAEALARWVDPHKGVLNVGTVISALEESYQIHKLDCCIIEQVCKEYRECVDEGKTPVPVSVNLSRLDFVCCDIYNSIERSRRKYSVPRNMINLEITESVFGSEVSVRNVVTRFRDAGYQVWMDDFGSGYSSLNLLKEFSFDELKLDMAFLSNFSDKGRSIIKSTIDMAKDIGIYTLAEGVETTEQYEFLKRIGCEKVQGFLFERPLPYNQFLESCARKKLDIEEPIWKDYYDEIGKINFVSDKPMFLLEYDNTKFSTMFTNRAFIEYNESIGVNGISEIEERLNSSNSPLNKAVKEFITRDYDIGTVYYLSFLHKEHYIKLSYKCIAKCAGRYVFHVCIENISDTEVGDSNKNTDNIIRSLYYMFDHVSLVNVDSDCAEEVFSNDSFKVSSHIIYGMSDRLDTFASTDVHPEDADRFREYVNFKTLRSRLKNSGKSMISDYFRVKSGNGEYTWKLLSFVEMTRMMDSKVIACIREVPDNIYS